MSVANEMLGGAASNAISMPGLKLPKPGCSGVAVPELEVHGVAGAHRVERVRVRDPGEVERQAHVTRGAGVHQRRDAAEAPADAEVAVGPARVRKEDRSLARDEQAELIRRKPVHREGHVVLRDVRAPEADMTEAEPVLLG